jgi:hypothetical protein
MRNVPRITSRPSRRRRARRACPTPNQRQRDLPICTSSTFGYFTTPRPKVPAAGAHSHAPHRATSRRRSRHFAPAVRSRAQRDPQPQRAFPALPAPGTKDGPKRPLPDSPEPQTGIASSFAPRSPELPGAGRECRSASDRKRSRSPRSPARFGLRGAALGGPAMPNPRRHRRRCRRRRRRRVLLLPTPNPSAGRHAPASDHSLLVSRSGRTVLGV